MITTKMFEYVFGYQSKFCIGYANQKPTNLTWAKQLDPARWRAFLSTTKKNTQKKTGCWKRDWIYLLVQLVYKIAMENHPFQKEVHLQQSTICLEDIQHENTTSTCTIWIWDFTLIDHGISTKPQATKQWFLQFSHTYSLPPSNGVSAFSIYLQASA